MIIGYAGIGFVIGAAGTLIAEGRTGIKIMITGLALLFYLKCKDY